MPAIHATAIVDSNAEIAPDVAVGPYTIITGPVRVGAGSKIGPHCHLIGPLTIGPNNDIGTGVVLGERPQHLAANGDGADVVIGQGNILREHVTVHRGSGPGKVTTIGDNNFFMANAHVGHDCRVGNSCILANSALLGGHVVVEDRVFMSGNSAVHQWVRMGRLCFLSGTSAATMDVPPFIVVQDVNHVSGVNVIGMKRAGYTSEEITAMRQAYRWVYMQDNIISVAVNKIETEYGHIRAIVEFVDFIRKSTRGISTSCGRFGKRAA